MSQYSLYELILTIKNKIITILFHRNARLIRYPFYLRGRQHFVYGKGLTTGYNCRLEMKSDERQKRTLIIGENCKMGDNVHIVAHNNVTIGNNCLLASKVFISDVSHGIYFGENASSPLEEPDNRKLFSKTVVIGDNVWIGENVVILPGVSIGDGSIIGAGSIVTKNIGKHKIVAGAPAAIIKEYNTATNVWEVVK